MLFTRFYIRIVILVTVALLGFTTITLVLLQGFEHRFYDDPLLETAPFLMEQLLPDESAHPHEYQGIISSLETELDLSVTVFSSDAQLIWGAANVTEAELQSLSQGDWRIAEEETQWTTKLQDGRFVSFNLDAAPSREELNSMLVFLPIIAIFVSIVILPFSRSMTGRLERLNNSVQKLGYSTRNERVLVEGSDEIATLAKSFNSAIDRINGVLRSQKILLANASHELRTPLARIRLGLELIQKNAAVADKYNLTDDIQELDELIDEILLLSRVSSGGAQDANEDVDLSELLNDEYKRYTGEDTNHASVPLIKGNARLIRRLLRNLLDNAYSHGALPVSASAVEKDGFVEVTVSDGGDGIQLEDQDRLFAPFTRGANKDDVAGHGLGLAIVKEIADFHTAEIHVSGGSISVRFSIN